MATESDAPLPKADAAAKQGGGDSNNRRRDPPSPQLPPHLLTAFGRFHALTCAVGFLTMLFSMLITLSGMFLNVLPYNCTEHQLAELQPTSNSTDVDMADAAAASDPGVPWSVHQGFRASLAVQYRLCSGATADLTNVAFFVGTIAGSLATGPTSDLVGRLRCSLAGQAMLAVASLASNYAPSLWLHLACRCLAGCFMVFAQCAIQVYGCEVHGGRFRGRFIAAWSTGISVGTLAAGLLAHLTRHHQLYVLASCGTALASLAASLCLPESPVWLAARGHAGRAEAAARRIRVINGADRAAAGATAAELLSPSPTTTITDVAADGDADADVARSLRALTCLLLRPVSLLGLHGLCLGLNCIGFYFVLSKVIPDVCLYAVLLGATQLPYAFVLNLIPRRSGLLACGLFSGLTALAFGAVSHFLPGWPYLLAACGVAGCFCSSAAFSLLVALSTEFFPTAVRSTGLGLCIFSLRLGSALAPLVSFLPGAPLQSLALACPLLLSNLLLGLVLAFAGGGVGSDSEKRLRKV